MDEPRRRPITRGDRALFWILAAGTVPAALALPFAWTSWSTGGTLLLVGFEVAIVSLLLVWRDPLRFQWAGRILLVLAAAGLLALALGAAGAADGRDRAVALALCLACAWLALAGGLGRPRAADEVRRATWGELLLEGRRLRMRDAGGESGWDLDVGDLLVVGEYTTEAWGDDYRLCFLRDASGVWLEASFYAAGCSETLGALGRLLGDPLDPGLCNSTTFRSRVLWPPELRDLPLLEECPPAAPRGALGRIRRALGLRGVSMAVSVAVLEHARR